MEECTRFVLAAKQGAAMMSEVCAEYGVSQDTGYRLLARYEAEGVKGLKDRSRAPPARSEGEISGIYVVYQPEQGDCRNAGDC